MRWVKGLPRIVAGEQRGHCSDCVDEIRVGGGPGFLKRGRDPRNESSSVIVRAKDKQEVHQGIRTAPPPPSRPTVYRVIYFGDITIVI